jgi:D-beta-D-heptose 7-phosphate kinase/D-beta-D-heptose 1-phosphate adenosyltransferase
VIGPGDKILDWESARRWRERLSVPLVFTNGVFDLLHRGHVDLLCAAASLGGALLVGVNSDASVRRLKGQDRPVQSQDDRAYVLAALESSDAVVVFHEDTPLELVRALRPDVLVKGGDYARADVVGGRDVEGWGGRVVIIPLTAGHSTTATLEALRGGT